MNILVLGNGFDVWHGLPTKYTDFIDFLKILYDYTTYSGDSMALNRVIGHSTLCASYAPIKEFFQNFGDCKNLRFKNELLDLIENNCWVEFFRRKKRLRNRWIDLERDISKVIQSLEHYDSSSGFASSLSFLTWVNETDFVWDINNRSSSIERLLNDLNRFIRCFEIYICLCVERIPIDKKLDCILKLQGIDKVLSFNYTSTFERVYAPYAVVPIEYCYIHGKASLENTLETNNMVLGVDEYLDEMQRNINTDFIRFKKYYQRIYKKTDYNYTNWLKEPGTKNIFIIGHSLDLTDQDVLQDMVLQEKYNNPQVRLSMVDVNTTVFYHSKKSNARQIENLVRLLGYDNLNSLARGADRNRHIVFSPLE